MVRLQNVESSRGGKGEKKKQPLEEGWLVKLFGFLFLEKPYHGLDDEKSLQVVGVCGGEVTERQGEELEEYEEGGGDGGDGGDDGDGDGGGDDDRHD